MSYDFPFVRLFGVRQFCYYPYLALIIFMFYLKQNRVLIITRQDEHAWYTIWVGAMLIRRIMFKCKPFSLCWKTASIYTFYTPVFKTRHIMVYQCPTVRPSVSHVALWLKNPLANSLQISQRYWIWLSYGLYTLWWNFEFFIPELWDFIHQIVGDFSYVTL